MHTRPPMRCGAAFRACVCTAAQYTFRVSGGDIPFGRYSVRTIFRTYDIPFGRYSGRAMFRRPLIFSVCPQRCVLDPQRLHITGDNTPLIRHGALQAGALGIPAGREIKNASRFHPTAGGTSPSPGYMTERCETRRYIRQNGTLVRDWCFVTIHNTVGDHPLGREIFYSESNFFPAI